MSIVNKLKNLWLFRTC